MISNLLLVILLSSAQVLTTQASGELSIVRMGAVDGVGLYTCISNAPNSALTYATTYLSTVPFLEIECDGELHTEVDQNNHDIYCFSPCQATATHMDLAYTVIVRAKDDLGNTDALDIQDNVVFLNVTPTVTVRGSGVVEAEWSGYSGSSYQVELLHEAAKRWRGARHTTTPLLHPDPKPLLAATYTSKALRSRSGLSVLEVSEAMTCSSGPCRYYFPGVPSSGRVTVELLDVTETLVRSLRLPENSLAQWGRLTMANVIIASENPDQDGSEGGKRVTVALSGDDETKNYTALLINDHDHTQVLESQDQECLPFGGGCVIRGIETLDDPDSAYPPTFLWLLISSQSPDVSALALLKDVQVEVSAAGAEEVQVEWMGVGGAAQYSVRLVREDGTATSPVLVDCGGRAGGCEASFSGLSNGIYTAEVTYYCQVTSPEPQSLVSTTATTTFTISTGSQECHAPFTEVGGRCLVVEAGVLGSWHDMSTFCLQLGGRLAVVNGEDVMYHLVQYIKNNGLQYHDYWIGASDQVIEGDFRWVDGTQVRMGTPYWGYYGTVQRPNGGDAYDCVHLARDHFLYFTDHPCTNAYNAICEQVD